MDHCLVPLGVVLPVCPTRCGPYRSGAPSPSCVLPKPGTSAILNQGGAGAASSTPGRAKRPSSLSLDLQQPFCAAAVGDRSVSMAGRPELPYGYLGPQGKWQDWGLCNVSHNSPEISTDNNRVDIQIRTSQPMKVTANLISCCSDDEYKDNVFTQTQGDIVTLVIAMPTAGFFKLQIYALLSSDESKTLPNVYNYLIHNMAEPKDRVAPFPKQFAQWKEGCHLAEPYHLQPEKDAVQFKVTVPDAKAVALTVDNEWYHLKKGSDGVWQGEVKGLQALRGKVKKASLNANYGPDETKYTSLLEYDL